MELKLRLMVHRGSAYHCLNRTFYGIETEQAQQELYL